MLAQLKEDSPPGLNASGSGIAHPQGSRFGDYELLEELGRGGMGIVYKALQVSLNRTVAVKMLLHGCFSSADYVRRFYAEAEAAASLQHANLVVIHEIGTIAGLHYFSMEYVEGPNLAEVVRDGPLPPIRAARYVEVLARAIHCAHQHGILHRDLKPSNIILDKNDEPRITDFGLAKRLSTDSEMTLTGQVLGAPAYMAPEQAAGKRTEVGIRSDVYALGAILYYLLSGRPPFVADTIPEILVAVQTEPPAPLLDPEIPSPLKTVCARCLEKNPADRYESAEALSVDLHRWLAGEPLLTARQEADTSLNSQPHIARWAVLAGGVVFVVLGVWLGKAVFHKGDASRSRLPPLLTQPPTISTVRDSVAEMPPLTHSGITVVWTRGADVPAVYEESGAAVLEGQLYVVGGRTGHGKDFRCVADVRIYDTEMDEWSQGPPLPEALAAVGVVANNGFLYCFGGVREPYWWGYPVASVYRLDPRGREWTRLADMPISRSNFALGVTENRIYCAGGSIYWPDATSRIDAYESESNRWIHSGVMPQPRGSFTGGIWKESFVLLPGLPGAKLVQDPRLLVFDTARRETTFGPEIEFESLSMTYLFGDDSGAYLLQSLPGNLPRVRVIHVDPRNGRIELCEPPSPVCQAAGMVAYDPASTTAYILRSSGEAGGVGTLEKARLLTADHNRRMGEDLK